MSNGYVQSSQKGDKESDCLEKCLQGISTEDRRLIEGYYLGERRSRIEKREQLAASLGVNPNVLRL
jgi:hypothetical protein